MLHGHCPACVGHHTPTLDCEGISRSLPQAHLILGPAARIGLAQLVTPRLGRMPFSPDHGEDDWGNQ